MNFLIEKGEQNIVTTEWGVPDPPEEYEGTPVLNACTINVDI
jgi:hypothetical protein